MKLSEIIVIALLVLNLLAGGVNLFSGDPEPVRTEQDIRNEIELSRIRIEIGNLRQLERMENEIIKAYEDSIVKIDSVVFSSTKQQRDSLRAIAFGL